MAGNIKYFNWRTDNQKLLSWDAEGTRERFLQPSYIQGVKKTRETALEFDVFA